MEPKEEDPLANNKRFETEGELSDAFEPARLPTGMPFPERSGP